MVDDGGLAKLQARFRAIPESVKAEVRRAMEKSADELVAMMKSLVPVDEGDLRDSIGWTWGTAPMGALALKTTTVGGMTLTVYAGNEAAYYARFVEFGTAGGKIGGRVRTDAVGKRGKKLRGRKVYRTHSGTEAQPFFFPAFRLLKKKIAKRIKSAMGRAIRKSRKAAS